jgi:hypothetical protein
MLGARSFAATGANGGPNGGGGGLSLAPSSHPYPPKRSAASSVSMSNSHVYVYERGNAHAADAMRFLAATAGHTGAGASRGSPSPSDLLGRPGSLIARTQQVLGSAEARAHSLFEQLQQFTVAPPRLESQRSRRRHAAVG